MKFLFIGLLLVNSVCWGESVDNQDNLRNGERIFIEGLDLSGQPLQGKTEGDIEFKDAHFNCAQCHRRSGYGSSEGGNYVLPITGVSLFNPRTGERSDIFQKLFKERQSSIFWARMRSVNPRPAYDLESLSKAVQEGVDPAGRTLSALMPRYQFSDSDMAALAEYLKKLSIQNDPGVDDHSIYFATVVSKGVNTTDKNVMLSTITKYVDWLNFETVGNQNHPNFSPNFRSDLAKGFRIWKHVVWELSDNPDAWPNELANYYRQQPVFALISGMVDGSWQPIHEFCEKNKLPSLFPFTPLPVTDQVNHYSVYFNQGLTLEAKVIAQYIAKQKSQPIIQIYADEAEGAIPAKVFTQSLNTANNWPIENFAVANLDQFHSDWKQLIKSHGHLGAVVIWPGKNKSAILAEVEADINNIDQVFLPSTVLRDDYKNHWKESASKLIFSYPNELPSTYTPHAFRVRAWMNTRKLEITNPALQFNTYYALNILQYGLEPIVDHFSRDYLLESIEHEAENALNPGTYPRLSLGPDQRFASKGAYLVKLDLTGEQLITPLTEWIVP